MKLGWFMGAIFCVMVSAPVYAEHIVATVNDTPISTFDVDTRIRLMKFQQADIFGSASVAQQKKQALSVLTDELIKKQAAQKEGITVSDDQIMEAIHFLEEQNNLKSGELRKKLAQKQIPWQALKNQIEVDLAWLRVLQKHKLGDKISDKTAQRKQDEIRKALQKPSYAVVELIVPDEETAYRVYDLLKTTPFDELIQTYSMADSKAKKGFVGWVDENHYGASVASVLRHMERGQISRPIQVATGYALLALQDKKAAVHTDSIAVWELAQMVVPPEKITLILKQEKDLISCDDFLKLAQKEAVPESIQHGMVAPVQLPADVYRMLKDEKIKMLIGPVETPDGDLYFMKCAVTQKQVVPTVAQLKGQLESEEMGLLSDKLLNSLKRYAVIVYK